MPKFEPGGYSGTVLERCKVFDVKTKGRILDSVNHEPQQLFIVGTKKVMGVNHFT